MHIYSPLLLTLLIGVGLATPLPQDDSELGFYFDDTPDEPVLSKRVPWGDFYNKGASQAQTAAPAATSQGDSRSVAPVYTAPAQTTAAMTLVDVAGAAPTVHSTILTGTVTKTLISKSGSSTNAAVNTAAAQNKKAHARRIGGWWQNGGGRWKSHTNSGISASSGPQWGAGNYKKVQSQGSSQPAPQGQVPTQDQFQIPPAYVLDSSPAPAASPAPAPKAAPAPAPAAAPSPAPAPAPNSGSSSSSNSGYMGTVNKWRSTMGLSSLTQDSELEGNALKTATDGNGQMKHELNPGTMGQVLAPGNAGNFENVFVGGWLCEKPSIKGLSSVCGSMSKGWDHSDGETGHADILSSTGYKKIGCALATGIWACDLA